MNELNREPTPTTWSPALVPIEVDAAPVRTVGPLRLAMPVGAPLVIGRRGRK